MIQAALLVAALAAGALLAARVVEQSGRQEEFDRLSEEAALLERQQLAPATRDLRLLEVYASALALDRDDAALRARARPRPAGGVIRPMHVRYAC